LIHRLGDASNIPNRFSLQSNPQDSCTSWRSSPSDSATAPYELSEVGSGVGEKGDTFVAVTVYFHTGGANTTTDQERLVFNGFKWKSFRGKKRIITPLWTGTAAGLSELVSRWINAKDP
jgi:hypothetical protein